MRASQLLGALGALLLVGPATAAPSSMIPASDIEKRGPTCNSPTNRACWSNGFTISTDYEASTPPGGVVRSYNLVLTEHDDWVGPDGLVKKKAMLINGGFPGPTIKADWGDTIKVTVTNNLLTNGTSIHWHGFRMFRNSVNDGANGVTECPLPPGATKTYTFKAEQYGPSWYHSHFSSQYANGAVGTIQINGPASLPYDIDLGVFPITDWYYGAADEIQNSLMAPGSMAPPSDNILFNGTHVNGQGGGAYARVKLTKGKRHLLHIINTSVDNTFTVSLVNHQFTVVGTDFVPVNSFTTSSLYLAVGQRYSVTIDANQAVGNYWFNVTFASNGLCGLSKIPFPAAIFQYNGASTTALPTIKGVAPPDSKCEDNTNFSPVISRTAPQSAFKATPANDIDVNLAVQPWKDQLRVYWKVRGSDMNITWDEPTLEYVAKGNLNFPQRDNVIVVPQANQWTFWVVENMFAIPHPMHLHGHDFLVLGRSPAAVQPFAVPVTRFNPASDIWRLNFNNPTRRDVTMLPGNGWLVVAFKSDNPGAWLFHCHIAWHVSQGLSVQFLERVAEIPSTVQLGAIEPVCSQWTSYYNSSPFKQTDSGLRM